MASILLGKVTDSSPLQYLKARVPIVVTELGIIIDFKEQE